MSSEGTPSALPRGHAPLYRALTEPRLTAGVPDAFAVGLWVGTVGLVAILHQYLAIPIAAAAHIIVAAVMRRDPHFFTIFRKAPGRKRYKPWIESRRHMGWFEEHRAKSERLPDLLPWAGLIGPVQGVVALKKERLQKSFAISGQDPGICGYDELVALNARLNAVLARRGSGWAVFIETQRLKAMANPSSTWPDPASWIVDVERRESYRARSRGLLESHHFLTYVWKLPPPGQKQVTSYFFGDPEGHAPHEDVDRDIDFFVRSVAETAQLLVADGALKEVVELDDAQTMTYLKSTVSRNRHPVGVPADGFYLDSYLPDQALTVGETPMLGDWYMPTAVVTGFPASTQPGLMAELDSLGFEFREVARFVCKDDRASEAEFETVRRGFWAKRLGFLKQFRSHATGSASPPLLNNTAIAKSNEVASALEDLGGGHVSYGRLTVTLTTWDTDYVEARRKMQALKQVFQRRGFTVRDETLNSLEAWTGSLPGNVDSNVRGYPVSTLNLAHLMPGATSVWSGDEFDPHVASQTGYERAGIYCATNGTTPFRYTTFVGDNGHFYVIGPPGGGKSFFINTLALQWRAIPGSRVVIFDKDRSARASTMAVGGRSYEPGRADAPVHVQPLARIDEPNERLWASQFVETLLLAQGYTATPADKERIDHALHVVAAKEQRQRRLFYFVDQLGDLKLAQILRPYTVGGTFGQIFDGDHDGIEDADWLLIEMGHLMALGDAVVEPALAYFFHRIEALFTGAMTLVVIDEAWIALQHAFFAERLKAWLKGLRKKNVAVGFATQDVADALDSPIMPTILGACETGILLPNTKATSLAGHYRKLKLSDAEIEMLEQLEKKRDYFYMSPKGRRVFTLDPGPVGLAFAGMASPKDQAALDEIEAGVPPVHYAETILRHHGLDEAANRVAVAVASGAAQWAS